MNQSVFGRVVAALPLILLLCAVSPEAASASTNLISNPSFVTPSATTSPMNWIPVGWGAAASSTFAYPVPGEDDAFAAQVTISNYPAVGEGNGSAEWLPGRALITPGALYTYSDWYKSDANSYLTVQWLLGDGTVLTEAVATLGPTGGSWVNDTQVFSAPANAVAVTPVHSIQSVGTLTIDNVSLSEGANPQQGTLSKAIISLTFDNGYASQYMNAFPVLKTLNLPATYYIITNQIRSAVYDFFTDPNQAISAATTSSSVTWSPIYTDPTVHALIFTDTYTSTATSTVEADYLINGVASSTMLGELSAGTGADAKFNFVLPIIASTSSTVSPIRIVHASTGALTASNPSLVENIPQHMTISQLQEVQAAGNEIGSHTVTHSDLTALSTTQVSQELANSKAALLSWGITPADGFAYPFGNYNVSIESLTKGAGYANGRSVDIGYNTAFVDPFALKSQSLVSTTPFSDVQSWIDTAIANKLWLIITFHDIDTAAAITANGETYGTTPQIFQEITDYLKSQQSKVTVLSVHDALASINASTTTDTTPPVIAPHENMSATTTSTDGIAVSYDAPTAADNVDGVVPVSCNPPSGTVFALGSTTVVCVAHDNAHNAATSTFVVAVTKTITTDASGGSGSSGTTPVSGGSSPSSGGGGGGSIGYGSSSEFNPLPWVTPDIRKSNSTASLKPKISKPATGAVLAAETYKFKKPLALRSHGSDVMALQHFLLDNGFQIPAGATGLFGSQTRSAVKAYQKANTLPQTGYVGSLTLALLNKGIILATGEK